MIPSKCSSLMILEFFIILDNCYKFIQKSYTASVLYYISTQDSMTCCYQRLKNIIIDRRR